MVPVSLDLRDAWSQLLERRRALAPSLAPYTDLLERWARAVPAVLPRSWSEGECRECWQRGVPLAVEVPPRIAAEDVEDLLGGAMEQVAALDPGRAPALQRLAGAWDAGAVIPTSLLPTPRGIGDGTVQAASGLDDAAVTVLAWATLRPALDAWLSPARMHVERDGWLRGVCPVCGAPPGFNDVIEGGHRRLACHLCGGAWGFPKLQCPLCGAEGTEPLYRLKAEGPEEGYVVAGCRRCHGYLKELDRRERWDGSLPILEDWGTPHLDLVARREGYRKPIPGLLDLAPSR